MEVRPGRSPSVRCSGLCLTESLLPIAARLLCESFVPARNLVLERLLCILLRTRLLHHRFRTAAQVAQGATPAPLDGHPRPLPQDPLPLPADLSSEWELALFDPDPLRRAQRIAELLSGLDAESAMYAAEAFGERCAA